MERALIFTSNFETDPLCKIKKVFEYGSPSIKKKNRSWDIMNAVQSSERTKSETLLKYTIKL